MLTYELTSETLKIQIKLSEFRWAAWKGFLRVQVLLVAVQICLWAIFVLLHVLLGIRVLQASRLRSARELRVPSCSVQPSTRHPGRRCHAITKNGGK